jgi:hypothetical protein
MTTNNAFPFNIQEHLRVRMFIIYKILHMIPLTIEEEQLRNLDHMGLLTGSALATILLAPFTVLGALPR